jgi:hypothetical protein
VPLLAGVRWLLLLLLARVWRLALLRAPVLLGRILSLSIRSQRRLLPIRSLLSWGLLAVRGLLWITL